MSENQKYEEWINTLIDVYNHSENDIKTAIDDVARELDETPIQVIVWLVEYFVETKDIEAHKEEIIKFCQEQEKADKTASKLLANLDIDIDI